MKARIFTHQRAFWFIRLKGKLTNFLWIIKRRCRQKSLENQAFKIFWLLFLNSEVTSLKAAKKHCFLIWKFFQTSFRINGDGQWFVWAEKYRKNYFSFSCARVAFDSWSWMTRFGTMEKWLKNKSLLNKEWLCRPNGIFPIAILQALLPRRAFGVRWPKLNYKKIKKTLNIICCMRVFSGPLGIERQAPTDYESSLLLTELSYRPNCFFENLCSKPASRKLSGYR